MIDLKIYSPVSRISGFGSAERGISLWMKRDDMIHPFISGNKWRKLKYTLREARSTGKRTLLTFGGAWSNHLLATACAGATFGFQTIGFVRGDEGVTNPVLSLCRMFGMELRFVDRETYRDKKSVYNAYLMEDAGPGRHTETYFIDEGGFGPQALQGIAEIIPELEGTAPYDHIFCACGTGATLAGLAMGLQETGNTTTRLHGIPVLKNAEFVAEQAKELVPGAAFEWHGDYHFGGYAKSNAQLDRFIGDFSSQTGILIESVYTGKLCYAVTDLLNNEFFKQGERVLILHSGGLTGLLGMYQRF